MFRFTTYRFFDFVSSYWHNGKTLLRYIESVYCSTPIQPCKLKRWIKLKHGFISYSPGQILYSISQRATNIPRIFFISTTSFILLLCLARTPYPRAQDLGSIMHAASHTFHPANHSNDNRKNLNMCPHKCPIHLRRSRLHRICFKL